MSALKVSLPWLIIFLALGGYAAARAKASRQRFRTGIGQRSRGPLLAAIQPFRPKIQLSDSWILNLTTPRWFSPKGRSVKGQGIQPEIVIEDTIMTDPRAARLGLAADPQVKAASTNLQALRKKGSSFK